MCQGSCRIFCLSCFPRSTDLDFTLRLLLVVVVAAAVVVPDDDSAVAAASCCCCCSFFSSASSSSSSATASAWPSYDSGREGVSPYL